MKLDSLSLIARYHGPLLQTHGTADTLIPFEQAQRLFQAANEPKWFVKAERRGHNDPPSAEFLMKMDRFLSELPPK